MGSELIICFDLYVNSRAAKAGERDVVVGNGRYPPETFSPIIPAHV
jgi:hypothetical protein